MMRNRRSVHVAALLATGCVIFLAANLSFTGTVDLPGTGQTGLSLDLDIKSNGQDGPIVVSPSTPVSIDISLDPGDKAGQTADWWIAVHTPFPPPLDWYTYVYPTGWLPGINLCAQTGLFDLSSYEVLNMTLPVGNYTFYFAIDDPDGIVTATFLDSVEVEVRDVNNLDDLMLIENMNPESPFMFALLDTNTKESISIFADKDQTGYPVKITGAAYTTGDGDFAVIQLGTDGLPTSLIDSLGNKVTFTNFTDSTAIVSVYSPAGELIEGPTTVSFSPTKIAEIKQLLGNIPFTSENILANKPSSIDDCYENLISLKEKAIRAKGTGLAFGWIFCVISAVTGNIPIMAKACISY